MKYIGDFSEKPGPRAEEQTKDSDHSVKNRIYIKIRELCTHSVAAKSDNRHQGLFKI